MPHVLAYLRLLPLRRKPSLCRHILASCPAAASSGSSTGQVPCGLEQGPHQSWDFLADISFLAGSVWQASFYDMTCSVPVSVHASCPSWQAPLSQSNLFWCFHAFPIQEEEEDESRPKKRGRYAKQDDDDFEPVSPLPPCLLPALSMPHRSLEPRKLSSAYGVILGMQCCPNW